MVAVATDVDPWSVRVACNLCGSRQLDVRFTARRSGRQVVRCRGCGLVFYDPQPSPAQAAALYSPAYFENEYPGSAEAQARRLAEKRLAAIENRTGVGALLDVGCGTGLFVAAAGARGWRAVGLDASTTAVGVAARRGLRVLEGDLGRTRPADVGPFDVLTLWDVLEHLTDPVGDLARARTWLRPGGLLVVQTQSVAGVSAVWMGRRWEQFVDAHLFHFSSATLTRALIRGDFADVRIESAERFAGVEPPAPVAGVRGVLARARDRVFIRRGCDPFDLMVATARRPEET